MLSFFLTFDQQCLKILRTNMAIILSIETSTLTSSIALHDQGALVASLDLHIDKSHSEYLTPSIKYLMDASGINMSSLDAVAISKGPGSYTGLRIGTSTAKGICYALDAKLIAVNTLEALAFGMSKFYQENTLLCPMIDARRMEVYCTVIRNDMTIVEKTQAKIIDESSFANLLDQNVMVFFGNGASKCKTALEHSKKAEFVDDIHPSAENVGALAWKSFQENRFEDVAYFEPFYLKDFIAKNHQLKNWFE